MPLTSQIVWLFLLAAPVACISWTITHEEVLREAREFCQSRSQTCRAIYQRKFFYVFTCEYCLSHYVSLAVVGMSGFRLLLEDWRGFVLAWFAVVWVANVYMSGFGRLRLEIKSERMDIAREEKELKDGPRPSAPGQSREDRDPQKLARAS